MTVALRSLLDRDQLTDVTIHSGGKVWKAHRGMTSLFFKLATVGEGGGNGLLAHPPSS